MYLTQNVFQGLCCELLFYTLKAPKSQLNSLYFIVLRFCLSPQSSQASLCYAAVPSPISALSNPLRIQATGIFNAAIVLTVMIITFMKYIIIMIMQQYEHLNTQDCLFP